VKKLVSVFAMLAILFFVAAIPAQAQINSAVATVPLQLSVPEFLSISILSGSPQVFPSGGGNANTPLVVSANWNFGQARHLSYLAYFTSSNGLSGTATGFPVPTGNFNLGSSAQNGQIGNGGPCGQSIQTINNSFPQMVTPPSAAGNQNVCPIIFDGAEPSGVGSVTSTLSLSVNLPANTPVDSYTGTLSLAASAL
jgi:hypothetical protein